MRLLHRDTDGVITLTSHFGKDKLPHYAVLSHTWLRDEDEAGFEDFRYGTWEQKTLGARKIRLCGDQAAKDGLNYFWVDTCCIDKSSSAELSEAITSMFRWYQNATKCYAYLWDVSSEQDDLQDQLTNARYFTRGWTLQELLAPPSVDFYTIEWELIGTRRSLEASLSRITGIPTRALRQMPLSQFSVEERMRWSQSRATKRPEDSAYCLFGVFDIQLPLLYGEGRNRALRRLKDEITRSAQYLPSSLSSNGMWKVEIPRDQESPTPQCSIQRSAPLQTYKRSAKVTPPLRPRTPEVKGPKRKSRRDGNEAEAPCTPTRARFNAFREVLVSCDLNASELSIDLEKGTQTLRPPQPLLAGHGNPLATARAVKSFIEQHFGTEKSLGKEMALHWTVPLMMTDKEKIEMRDAAMTAGFSPNSRVVSQIEAVSSPMVRRHRDKRARRSSSSTLSMSDDDCCSVRHPKIRKRNPQVEKHACPSSDKNMLVLLCNDNACEMAVYTLRGLSGTHQELVPSQTVTAGWAAAREELRKWILLQSGARICELNAKVAASNGTLMVAFEQYLANISGLSTTWEPCRLPLELPGLQMPVYNAVEKCVVLDRGVLLSLLTPSLDAMKLCISQMIAQMSGEHKLAEISIMGSFVDIPYVRAILEEHARFVTKGLVPVVYRMNVSVTSGAIMREVQNVKPTSTKALRHYGCICDAPFREGIDPPSKASWSVYFNAKICRHRVIWLIQKGQDITTSTVASSQLVLMCNINAAQLETEVRFASAELDVPPDWADGSGVDADTGVIVTAFTLEEVKANFTFNNGVYGLDAEIRLRVGSEAGVLEGESIDEKSGKILGKTAIRFD